MQYLLVDDATLAVNLDEARAETNVSKTAIIHDSDDCLKGGKPDTCVEYIDLET